MQAKRKQAADIIRALSMLYEGHGYSLFRMNRFEEYAFYLRNRDSLVSDRVITFTDVDGRLMALKPDVTLSIIKNGGDTGLRKVYYNENVFRVPRDGQSFQEIPQTGLECMGDIDGYCLYEVLLLAARSLEAVSEAFVLDISHMGVLTELLEAAGLAGREKLLECIAAKNLHDLPDNALGQPLRRLFAASGSVSAAAQALEACYPDGLSPAAKQLLDTARALEAAGYAGRVRIDFSVLNDMHYYSGIVFQGFVKGIPTGILSGGQYDRLMRKMGRQDGAVGFALYPDLLQRFGQSEPEQDADVVVLYTADTNPMAVSHTVEGLAAGGQRVLALRQIPKGLRYGCLVRMEEGGFRDGTAADGTAQGQIG